MLWPGLVKAVCKQFLIGNWIFLRRVTSFASEVGTNLLYNTYRLGMHAGGTFTRAGTFARPRRSSGGNKYASGYVLAEHIR